MKFDPAEMAMILEQVRQEVKKHQLGSTEPGKIYTFDGDMDGKVITNGCVKISDTPMDLTLLTKATLTIHPDIVEEFGTSYVEYTDIVVLEETAYGQVAFSDEIQLAVSVKEPGTDFPVSGLYVVVDTMDEGKLGAWISELKFSKVIHPIPQEYIPPLDALYLNGTDGVRYKLYVDAAGQLQVEVV